MILYHDIPSSQGMENALRRARQLVEFPWTPVEKFPAGQHVDAPEGRKRVEYFLPAWKARKGIVYSSPRKTEKFLGFNVSLETYTSTLTDPRSVVYTRPQYGLGLSMWNYYGIVCSVFASHVLELPLRRTCGIWTNFGDCTLIDSTDLENLQLCDLLLDPTRHIAVITDIERDIDGKVHYITVSESTSPTCVATRFSTQGFRGYWLDKGYRVWRYNGLDGISYTPSPYVPLEGDPPLQPDINTSLLPNFGDKANYALGETVDLNVLEDGWTSVRISGPEEHVLPVEDAKVTFTPAVPGYYTACCVNGSAVSKPVEFCVTDLAFSCDKVVWKAGEPLTMTFRASDPEDQLLGWIIHNTDDSMRGIDHFSQEECGNGSAVIHGVGKGAPKADTPPAPGNYYIFALAKNKFGVYRSAGHAFRAE